MEKNYSNPQCEFCECLHFQGGKWTYCSKNPDHWYHPELLDGSGNSFERNPDVEKHLENKKK